MITGLENTARVPAGPTGFRPAQETASILRLTWGTREYGLSERVPDSWKNGRLRQPPDYQESRHFTQQTADHAQTLTNQRCRPYPDRQFSGRAIFTA